MEGSGSNIWFESNKELSILPIGKLMNSLQNQKPLGYIVLYVDTFYVEQVFQDVSFTEADNIFLVDGNKQLVIGTMDLKSLPEDVLQQDFQKIGLKKIKLLNSNKEFCYSPLKNVDWVLMSISDDESYHNELSRLRKITVGLFGGILFLITGLSILIARGISKPIRMLAKSMEQFSRGDFSVHATVIYEDEIGNLRKSFNKMVQDMEILVHNVYEEKNLKHQAQIQALQMQINPHFLYNTLDTINWMAVMRGASDVAEVSRSLGYLMRFSLKEEDLISFEEELDAVEHYICIQKYRYGEGLSIEIDVEEDALYEKIPKHIILPMIENSIEHGFADKKDDKKIRVIGRLNNREIRIEILDNGIGMTKEILESATNSRNENKRETGKHMSIGITNVNKRLKLRYGDEYGLYIQSNYGKGTLIGIVIPRETEGELDESSEI